MNPQTQMAKPTPRPIGDAIRWNEAVAYIEALIGRDIRDWMSALSHFDKWCDTKGLGQVDPNGEPRGSSQVWYAEYTKDPNGLAAEPPYHDFWHWIVYSLAPHNGCIRSLHAEFSDMCRDKWAWAKEVLDIFLREFGEGAKFWIEW